MVRHQFKGVHENSAKALNVSRSKGDSIMIRRTHLAQNIGIEPSGGASQEHCCPDKATQVYRDFFHLGYVLSTIV